MSDISQGPKSATPHAPGAASEVARATTPLDLSALELSTGLASFDPVARTPHSRESVGERWRHNREIADTGTRMIIRAGGTAA